MSQVLGLKGTQTHSFLTIWYSKDVYVFIILCTYIFLFAKYFEYFKLNILLDIFTSSILFLYLQNSKFLSPTSRVPQKMNWCLGEYFFVKVILNNYCDCTITVTVQLFYICSTLRITGFIQGISAFTYNILYIYYVY